MASPAAVVPRSVGHKFVRKPPPFPMRLVFGLLVHGVIVPAKWLATHIPAVDRFGDRIMTLRAKRGGFDRSSFDGFTPGPQDVFIPTFSKSGTNWMMQIALQLIYHGQAEFEHIHELVPWPDMSRFPYAIPLAQADHWKTAAEKKRVIKTHLDWEHLPYSPESRYICVIRDPKDVFVSSYHFVKGILGPGMPTVDTWYKVFLNERFPLGGSWVKNAASYWEASKRPNVLICSFKEMKQDLRGTVERVARFLDIDAAPDVIDRVAEKSSFEYMKKIDHKFGMFQMLPWGAPHVTMIREGKQGASGGLLSVEQQRAIDERFQARLKELGSDFPYERFCELK